MTLTPFRILHLESIIHCIDTGRCPSTPLEETTVLYRVFYRDGSEEMIDAEDTSADEDEEDPEADEAEEEEEADEGGEE